MSVATSPTLELNNGVTMPALGLSVFQTPADVTSAAVEEPSASATVMSTQPPQMQRARGRRRHPPLGHRPR